MPGNHPAAPPAGLDDPQGDLFRQGTGSLPQHRAERQSQALESELAEREWEPEQPLLLAALSDQ